MMELSCKKADNPRTYTLYFKLVYSLKYLLDYANKLIDLEENC